jgi:hypothetical protein
MANGRPRHVLTCRSQCRVGRPVGMRKVNDDPDAREVLRSPHWAGHARRRGYQGAQRCELQERDGVGVAGACE